MGHVRGRRLDRRERPLDMSPVVAALAAALSRHAVIIENDADTERSIFRARGRFFPRGPFP